MKAIHSIVVGLSLVMASSAAIGQAAKHHSMIRVLASPENYSGSLISLSGVLGRENDAFILFVNSESEMEKITINAFRLMLSEDSKINKSDLKGMVGKYVIVSGIFDAESPQNRNFSGLIRDVSGIRAYPLLMDFPDAGEGDGGS